MKKAFRALAAAALASALLMGCPPAVVRDVLVYAEDGIKPTITVTSPTNRSPFDSSMTFFGKVTDSAVDEGDGKGKVDSLSYAVVDHESLNGTAELSEDGTFSFTIDTHGLSGDQTVIITAVDWNKNKATMEIEISDPAVGPDVTISSPASNSVYLSAVTVTGVVNNRGDSVSASEVDSLHYEVLGSSVESDVTFSTDDGSFSFNFSTVTPVPLKGRIVVRLTAKDKNGRTSEAEVELLDRSDGPNLQISSPETFSNYQASVKVTGTVTNNGSTTSTSEVKSLSYQVLGKTTVKDVTYTAGTGAFSFSFSTINPDPMHGNLIVQFVARDKNDRSTVMELTLLDDETGPYVTVDPPLDGTNYGATVTLAGTVRNAADHSKTSDVKSLKYVINAQVAVALDFDDTGAFSKTISSSGFGRQVLIKIIAEDKNGHLTEERITMNDGLPAPTIDITDYPNKYSSAVTPQISVAGTVSSPETLAVNGLRYRVDYGSSWFEEFVPDDDIQPDGSFSFFFGTDDPDPDLVGNFSITVTATDDSGRTSSDSVSVNDDVLVPYIALGILSADNAYIDVTFSEPVFTSASGAGGLDTGDIQAEFQKNGGTVTSVSIDGVTTTDDPGDPLEGGELQVRVWITPDAAPAGVETVAIKASGSASMFDTVGNPMGVTATTGALTLRDETAPAAPGMPDLAAEDDLGPSSTDNVTSRTTGLTFSGTGAEQNSTVKLYSDFDGLLGSTSDTGSGSWTIPSASLSAGTGVRTHQITATATDGAEHESAESVALVVTIDVGAGGAPWGLDLATEDDTGRPGLPADDATDNRTSQTSGLTISGSGAEDGGRIDLSSNIDGLWGSVNTTGSSWSLDISLSAAVPSRTHQITAVAYDQAGNPSDPSDPLVIVIDTTAPAAPSSPPNLADEDDTGRPGVPGDTTDNRTNKTSGLTFTGGGSEADGRIVLYSSIDGEAGYADTTGTSWSADAALASANPYRTHNVTAKAMDKAGNLSAASGPLAVTIDDTAPSAPTGLDLDPTDDTGRPGLPGDDSTDHLTSQTTGLTISGSDAEANGRIYLYSDFDSEVGSVDTTASSWSLPNVTLSTAVPFRQHTVTAQSMDKAGNLSGSSAILSITIDTTDPTAPTALGLAAEDDSGRGTVGDDEDHRTKYTTALTISGLGAEVGGRVYLSSDRDGSRGYVDTTGSSWSKDIALSAAAPSKTHQVTAIAYDKAGNDSVVSAALEIIIDNTAPSPAPAISNLDDADDSGRPGVSGDTMDNRTSQTSGLTFTGTGAEAEGRIVLYSSTDGEAGYADTAGGPWSADASLSSVATGSRTHQVTAKAMDTAGNLSAASAQFQVIIDVAAPAAPTGLDLATADDTGRPDFPADDATDNLTSNTSALSISGSGAENNGRIYLYSDFDLELASKDTTTSSWTKDVALSTAVPFRLHAVTAKSMDKAGNLSDPSDPLSITIDTTDPSAPADLDLAADDDTGRGTVGDDSDNRTSQISALAISGSGAEADGRVYLYSDRDGELAYKDTTGSSWSKNVSLTPVNPSRTHNVTAVSYDKAGNDSVASDPPLQIIIDTTAPSAPTISDLDDVDDSGRPGVSGDTTDNRTNVTSGLTFTGTGAEADGRINLYSDIDSGVRGYADTTGSSWSADASLVTGAPPDAPQTHKITAKSMDKAGNESAASSQFPIIIDTEVPTGGAPVGPVLDSSDDTGVKDGGVTSQTTNLTFSGTGTVSPEGRVVLYATTVPGGVTTEEGYVDVDPPPDVGWTVDLVDLAVGTYDMTAKKMDVAGNLGPASSPLLVKIDQTAPLVTDVDSVTLTYVTGNTIPITIYFDEQVSVTGTPTLLLDFVGTDRNASYKSGGYPTVGKESELWFEYVVLADDQAAPLDYVDQNSLAGDIRDLAGNALVVNNALAAPGGDGAISPEHTVGVNSP